MDYVQKGGIVIFYYLDDFITVGAPRSEECTCNIATMKDAYTKLGMPIKFDKSEGPTTSLTFLGIELDTVTLELHLPLPKLEQLKSTLVVWRGQAARYIQKRILSLIGLLSSSKSRTNIFTLHD